jgi:hypothetical protein
MTTMYRGYLIALVGEVYVAQSEDDQSYMISTDQSRLNSAIDEIWTALDKGVEPAWFSGSTAIDLDHLAIEAESAERGARPQLSSVKPVKVR